MADDFPRLPSGTVDSLRVISRHLKDNPAYFESGICPYSASDQAWLKSAFLPKDPSEDEAKAVVSAADVIDSLKTPEQWSDLAVKAYRLYEELETLQDSNLDPGEKIQVIKAKAGLLERLNIAGKEALGYKQVAEFMKTIMEIMEEVLDQDQRVVVMSKLEGFR